ncbi:MAG: N-acetylmuramoyl-L-alanine amidase [Calditrichaeota bacterium]|nr:N-acetylmuramoyl-L-alanine amidase [Calditrichota bacterium]
MSRFSMIFLIAAILAFSFCQQESPTKQAAQPFMVIIDAGHGGSDPGAVGFNGIKEKDVVLEVARQCEKILAKEKINVILTRSEDKFVRLNDRILFINRKNPNLVISLHSNSSRAAETKGIDTFLNSYKNAAVMDSIFSKEFNRTARQTNRMGGKANFSILKLVKAPVVYLGLGYMSNEQDCSRLSDATFQKKLAATIAESVLKFRDAQL